MPKKQVIKKSALSPTVLLVGGAGFIGSHLAEALLLKESRVIVLDNFSTGKDIYVQSLLDNPKFALFDVDINAGLPKELESVDYIIHLAGLETYLFDKSDVNLDALLTNAVGTKNVLDFCKKSSAKFLLVSSIDVYSGFISPKTLEQYFGHTPQEEKKYSLTEAKRYAEALVWEYYKKHRIDVRIARLPEIYGPRMNLNATGSLGHLIQELVENKNLTVWGEGTEKEYYSYISDAVTGIIKALFSENTTGKIYTFVENEPRTVLETAYLLKSLSQAEITVDFKQKTSAPRTEPLRDLDRGALKELGWAEKVDFESGITKSLNWLGYAPNKHSFKPNKLVEKKEQEKGKSRKAPSDSVDSIVDAAALNAPLRLPNKPKTHKFRVKFKLPKFKLPRLKKLKSVSTISSLQIGSQESAQTPQKNQLAQAQDQSISVPKTIQSTQARTLPRLLLPLTYLGAVILALLVFAGVPFLQGYVHVTKGVSSLENARSSLLVMDANLAQTQANEAFMRFNKASSSLNRVRWVFAIVGKKDLHIDIQKVLTSAEYSSRAVFFFSKGSTSFISLWEGIRPNSESKIDAQVFSDAALSFETANESLKFAVAQLNDVDFSKLSMKVEEYKQQLFVMEKNTDLLVSLTSEIPDLIGIGDERSYLILFQNSNEIRPTGGFIGSYALLEMTDGKISNLTIDDIYNPDGQIDLREIEVDSPEPIKLYLEEEFLHIRNANWAPDFTESAKAIEDLFFKIDGRTFDGVIAVDLSFASDILKVTGPVFLTAYNEEISAENLYERTQFHSEFNYTEGSDQKRSFMTVLGGKVLESIFSLENTDVVNLVTALGTSLEQKHLLVHIPNNSINALFDARGWNGKVVNVADGIDYLQVVNANVGGTKANYYVKNSMDYSVMSKTRDGLLRSKLRLNYEHTGEDDSWPGGPYTNYVRVLTAKRTRLTGAVLSIDGSDTDIFEGAVWKESTSTDEVDSSIIDAEFVVVDNSNAAYEVYAFGFTINPKQSATLTLEYDLPKEMSLEGSANNYNLYWQKQAGTRGDKVSFKYNAPLGATIVSVMPDMTVGSNTTEFGGALDNDVAFGVVTE